LLTLVQSEKGPFTSKPLTYLLILLFGRRSAHGPQKNKPWILFQPGLIEPTLKPVRNVEGNTAGSAIRLQSSEYVLLVSRKLTD